MKNVRCAVYTRKSSEEGLEQEFNSLDAQREACEAYIASQKHEGWALLPNHYDDGGISGGTLERAGLQRLLQDVDDGLVDQIVVYKIDRLTRSLADFAKLVERLDAAEASFVSVTQSFNTATSMGRLTLNVLLSFAQFEREVTAERIRDKIAASKKKGLWMGGNVPLGYEPDGRTLMIEEDEAVTIRTLYNLYLQHGSIRAVKYHADRLGLRTKARAGRKSGCRVADNRSEIDPPSKPYTTGEGAFGCGHIHYILANPLYAGRIRHREQVHEGQHQPIIDPVFWEKVQNMLKATAGRKRGRSGSGSKTSPLAGKLFDETGDRLTPSHANKKGRRYRYYVSNRLIGGARNKDKSGSSNGWRLPAMPLEQQLADAMLTHLKERLPNDLLVRPDVDLIRRIGDALGDRTTDPDSKHLDAMLTVIDRATIKPGQVDIVMDREALADQSGVEPETINADALRFTIPFRFRKRGVEMRLVIGNAKPGNEDWTLIRSIAKAHQYYRAIRQGQTFDDIAASEKLSKRRILQVIDLAFKNAWDEVRIL